MRSLILFCLGVSVCLAQATSSTPILVGARFSQSFSAARRSRPGDHRLHNTRGLGRMPQLAGDNGSSPVRRPRQSVNRLQYSGTAERYCGLRERSEMITHANGTAVSSLIPAVAGEELVAYATGLGQTNPALTTGQPAAASSPTIATYNLDFNYRPNALATRPSPTAAVPLFAVRASASNRPAARI